MGEQCERCGKGFPPEGIAWRAAASCLCWECADIVGRDGMALLEKAVKAAERRPLEGAMEMLIDMHGALHEWLEECKTETHPGGVSPRGER